VRLRARLPVCVCIATQPDAHMFTALKPEASNKRRLWKLVAQFYTNSHFSSLELRLIFCLFDKYFSAEKEGIVKQIYKKDVEGNGWYLFNIVVLSTECPKKIVPYFYFFS
jgi:hypothetical protein